jgi:hypothetical protein
MVSRCCHEEAEKSLNYKKQYLHHRFVTKISVPYGTSYSDWPVYVLY